MLCKRLKIGAFILRRKDFGVCYRPDIVGNHISNCSDCSDLCIQHPGQEGRCRV